MSGTTKIYKGSCLCGGVVYKIQGPLRPVVGCHCVQCRKTSGHHVAATQGHWSKLNFANEDGLAWYQSSETAQRGFCKVCGSSLFWRRFDNYLISISAGTLDNGDDLQVVCHIHADTPGAHYQLNDGLPQLKQFELDSLVPPLEE